ncbi:hypothetical protein K32_17210 [Kaistia sp. 32K]|nr:hypothetical protein K32_17210 [Kaistia sp. 32K]
MLGEKIAGNGGDGSRAEAGLPTQFDTRQWTGPPNRPENEAPVLATHEFCVGFALHDSLPGRTITYR